MERQAVAKVEKVSSGRNHRQPDRSSAAVHPLLTLQRSIGNQAVRNLIRTPYIQTKLQISTPEDPFEEEADRVADTVMRMPEPAPSIQAQPLSTSPAVVQRSPDDTGDVHQNLEDQFTREHGRPPVGGAHGAEYATWLNQKNYDGAVALLQSRDPTMYGYLRQGRVGQTVRVRTLTVPITGAGPGQPTSFEFRFDLLARAGGVASGALAQFETQQPNLQMTVPTATATLLMPMNFSSPDGPNAALRLAEYLYHEGIHMLLAMDRVIEDYIPGSARLQSGKRAAVEAYRTQVQSNRAFLVLAADLEIVIGTFMTQHNQSQPQAYYRDAAQRVINGVIDERFAVDQQRQQFPGNPVANSTIASAYIPNELRNEGIILTNNVDLNRLIQEMTAVLNLIPAGGSTPAVRPSPNPPQPSPPTRP